VNDRLIDQRPQQSTSGESAEIPQVNVQGISGEKKQRKSGIYQKSVKKERA